MGGYVIPGLRDSFFGRFTINLGVMLPAVIQRIDLDANINDILVSWMLKDHHFTAAQPVTLRMLLNHTAGATVHGFLSNAL